MKKQFYLLLAVIFSSSAVFAQSSQVEAQQLKNNQPSKSLKTVPQSKDFDNPLWESDFSDPADWEIDNEVGNNDDWVIGTDVPSGAFAIAGINSTTADNGFALFDSDLLCSGSQNAWIATAEAVDISTAESVSVQFETYFRDFQGQCFIETSLDGNVWTSTEILDLEVNAATDNPEIITLYLSELDGEDSAFIRFRYAGGCDYAWMIDDFKVAATPEFDLRLNAAWYDDHIIKLDDPDATVLEYLENLEYSQYSVGNTRPLTMVGVIENLGTQDMTEVQLVVTVNTPDGPEEFSSDPITIASFAVDTVSIPDAMLDAFDNDAVGSYTVDFLAVALEVEPDETNNTIASKSFTLSEGLLSNDRDDTYQTVRATANDCIWGNQVVYMSESSVNYIEFGLDDEVTFENLGTLMTIPGEVLYANIRQGSVLDEEGPDNVMERLFDDEELEYTIEENDISSAGELIWIRIPLDATIALDAGVVYQSEVELPPIGAPFALLAQTRPQEALAGVLFDVEDPSTGPQGWFTLGSDCPAIRMGFDPALSSFSAEPVNYEMGQNFPNPTSGSTRVSWELKESADNVIFRITDNTGKTVYQRDLGDRPAGVQEDIILDNTNLAAGVYQYSLTIGDTKVVRKMVIAK